MAFLLGLLHVYKNRIWMLSHLLDEEDGTKMSIRMFTIILFSVYLVLFAILPISKMVLGENNFVNLFDDYIDISISIVVIIMVCCAFLLKCPCCRLSVYLRRSQVFGYISIPWAGRKCARCGLDFTEKCVQSAVCGEVSDKKKRGR